MYSRHCEGKNTPQSYNITGYGPGGQYDFYIGWTDNSRFLLVAYAYKFDVANLVDGDLNYALPLCGLATPVIILALELPGHTQRTIVNP